MTHKVDPAKEKIFSMTKKDFDISYFSGSGSGGQHRNKHQNCVRIQHKESGVMAVGQDGKSKEQNSKMAFRRVTNHPKFKSWLKIQIAKASSDYISIDRRVEELMKPENLKIELFRGQ